MKFFVFSYNRGDFLENCIRSIEHCAPGSAISVYDDLSDDPETRRVLREIESRYEVVYGEHAGTGQHGGLYANMQRALDSVADDAIVCFLQDDTQLVRPVTAEDRTFIRTYFSRDPRCGFLAPVFLRGITKQRTLAEFEYDTDYGVYVCRHVNPRCAGVYYSDIFVASGRRLKDAGWRFRQDELDNERQARTLFKEMGYLYAPFAMWLPNGPAFRHRQKPLAYRIAEKRNRAGLYPFEYMTDAAVRRLRERPPAQRPIAEHYLETRDRDLEKPWIYHPLKRSRLLRKLHKLETFLGSLRK